MRTAESETVIAEAAGVTVEKRFEPDEFPVPAIAFTISSKRDDPITLRMHDTLPDEVNSDHIGLHPEYGGEHWTVKENSAVFKRPFDPNEEYITVYGLRHIYVDTADQFLVEPEIEILDPATDILGENSGQHVRDVIAGESDDGRGRQTGTGNRGGVNDRGVPSVRPGRRRTEESQPARGHTESVAESLAEEIRSGRVDSQTLQTLRESLGVDRRQSDRSQRSSNTKSDSSMDARIRRLQADVGDLRAYTDALEGFLDENGEAQVILSDFRKELDDLSPRVNSLETQTNELSTTVETVEGDVRSLTGDVDSIQEYVDSLSDDLGTLESDFDTASSDISRLQSRVRRMDNSTATEEELDQIRAELDDLASFRERMQSVFDP
ncbi:hypothetical protein [Halocatena halophila]|uniref:hypothetical protein n=1 Tax=Halocatena halophila TaxID=2814576 RepID=UPI002ED2AF5F